jgi:hypothetical protein
VSFVEDLEILGGFVLTEHRQAPRAADRCKTVEIALTIVNETVKL